MQAGVFWVAPYPGRRFALPWTTLLGTLSASGKAPVEKTRCTKFHRQHPTTTPIASDLEKQPHVPSPPTG
ncbi:MAG: hypothetical protein DWH82_08515 [Planctomycetota bacterium]|nr:MAG: hypothetical protein DWH82_08515 [Planctomycetota bacterium]